MVNILVQINPKYKNCVKTYQSGRKIMFGKLKKAMHGTLLGAVMFYNTLCTFLESLDFVVDPYDECTFNKIVNNKQCTLQFHMDNLMISHVNMNVVKEVVEDLNEYFGTIKLLFGTYGKIHEYLGIQIDLSKDQQVKISMQQYLEDILSEMPCDMDGISPWPANKDIFVVDENPEQLDKNKSDFFHQTTASLLYASNLCKRVKSKDLGLASQASCPSVLSSASQDLTQFYLRHVPARPASLPLIKCTIYYLPTITTCILLILFKSWGVVRFAHNAVLGRASLMVSKKDRQKDRQDLTLKKDTKSQIPSKRPNKK